MKRIYIKDIKEQAGQTVTIQGWVQTIRDQGSIVFLLIRDRTGIIQTVAWKDVPQALETAKKLSLESVVKITGLVKEEQQAPNGIEIAIQELEILSLASPELPIPVVEKDENETDPSVRLDWRWLDLRKPERFLIYQVWTTLEKALVEYWTTNGCIQVHSPKMMSTPSESGAELFEVAYFERKAYLAQSPQFYKQMAMAAGFERIFEIGPVFRAEPSFTTRHATEYTGYDAEISFIESHQEVMTFLAEAIQAGIKAVKELHGDAVKQHFNREIVVPELPFPQITMKEAKAQLSTAGVPSEKAGDLSPEEERKLSELIKDQHGHEFVFVTEYPAAVRAFYHMRLENDPTLTKSFDLMWNGVEMATGAQREHRPEQLAKQAQEKGLSLESIKDYLNFFRYGCPPHGGFGLGAERLVIKLLNLEGIREASYIYRGVKRLTP